MAVSTPNGAKFFIASTYGAEQTFSSISNASEAVASFAAAPSLVAGDIIEVSSGWQRLDKRIVRVKTVSGAGPYLVTFEAIDTSSTTQYPAGGGAGSVRKITAWTQITQVEAPTTSGGELSFIEYRILEEDLGRRLPDQKSAEGMQLTFFDDPSLAWYSTVQNASENNQTLYAMKSELRSGAIILRNAYWGLKEMPQMEAGAPMRSTIDLAFEGRVTRYAS